MKFPLTYLGKPFQTLTEHKKEAWKDLIPRYRVTCPVETRKQWKSVLRFKEKAS